MQRAAADNGPKVTASGEEQFIAALPSELPSSTTSSSQRRYVWASAAASVASNDHPPLKHGEALPGRSLEHGDRGQKRRAPAHGLRGLHSASARCISRM